MLGAGQDLHQRRLARTVLADEDVDLAAEGLERDVFEGSHPAVALGDVDGSQDDVVLVPWLRIPLFSTGGRGRMARRLGHDTGSSRVGTTSTTPGATIENAPAKSTFFPTRSLADTPASTSLLTFSLSPVPASA